MTVRWRELRQAALSATRWGWPVTPGTFLGSDRRWCGRKDATALCPIEDTWQDAPAPDPKRAEEIWSQHPYGVLLVCGLGVDVLEWLATFRPPWGRTMASSGDRRQLKNRTRGESRTAPCALAR